MVIVPKAIYIFNTIPIKIPMTYITEIEKVHMETQETVNSQGNTQQKSNAGDITVSDFK
jgi:predicted ribonuclease YlaK